MAYNIICLYNQSYKIWSATIKKRTSSLLLLLSYYNFDIYLSMFNLLECNLFWFDPVKNLSLFLKFYDCKSMT